MTMYDAKDLAREAKLAAHSHAKENGGGRPFSIAWTLNLEAASAGRTLVCLVASYYCNRPNGHCGRYHTNVAI